jgi:23S rRNA (cytidine1920-2'-O)/16S rRNA (cytidine1409-2'-O)-methyltransferase
MKKRLDILVSEKMGVSRSKAQGYIMAGRVFVNDRAATKAGLEFDESDVIEITEVSPYVSRGAEKLEGATKEFEIDFKNKIVCDVGASTGGFTDFALQNGAKKVYAIDVGYGQLDKKLRDDKRVINMERTNIRNINELPEKIDIFVIDVSFISLKKILPQVITVNKNSKLKIKNYDVVALIKPQFEVGKKIADKYKGVIKDKKIQEEVLEDIKKFAQDLDYIIKGVTTSPIKGAKGNAEFLLYLLKN